MATTDVVIVTQPLHGTLNVGTFPNLTYSPAAGFSGSDTFSYKVRDSLGAESGVVVVTSHGAQGRPRARGGQRQLLSIGEDGVLTVAARACSATTPITRVTRSRPFSSPDRRMAG